MQCTRRLDISVAIREMWRESLDDAKPEDSDDSHEVFRLVCGHHGTGGFSAPLGTQLPSVQGDRVRMEGAPRESSGDCQDFDSAFVVSGENVAEPM